MAVGGKKREGFDKLDVGFVELEVLAFSPNKEKILEIYEIDVNDPENKEKVEKFKEPDYTGNKDGVKNVRVEVWFKGLKTEKIYRKAFFLEKSERVNKAGTVYQFINDKGQLTWADDEANLPSWFVKNGETRKALVGEEALYNFLRNYLTELDFRDESTKLDLDSKQLFNGNFEELNELVGSGYEGKVVGLATVRTVEKEGEVKQYQNLYEVFLPGYSMKEIRNSKDNYTPENIEVLRKKNGQPNEEGKKVYLRGVDAFIVGATDPEYGCKDEFVLKPVQEYNPAESFAASNEVIQRDDTSAEY